MKGVSVGRSDSITRVKLNSPIAKWEIGYYNLDNLEVERGVGIGRGVIIEASSEDEARAEFKRRYPDCLFVSIEKVVEK